MVLSGVGGIGYDHPGMPGMVLRGGIGYDHPGIWLMASRYGAATVNGRQTANAICPLRSHGVDFLNLKRDNLKRKI